MSIIDKIRSKFSNMGKKHTDTMEHTEKLKYTVLFEKINVTEKAKEMNLDEWGRNNGQQGVPPLDSEDLDHKENEITQEILQDRSKADEGCVHWTHAYESQINKLNFQERLNEVDGVIHQCQVDLDEEVKEATGELNVKQGDLRKKERDLEEFKEKNRLDRSPNLHNMHKKILSAGIISVLFLLETMANTSFLAKGNVLGIFGAYTEAIAISFANLGIAFLLGRLTTNLVHIRKSRKLVGFLVATVFIVFAIFFNLLVAHYREITGSVLDEGGQLAIATFRENPFGLKDFQSWMLFFVGFLFAIISFIDGILWDDIYPGYGKVARSYEQEKEEYAEYYEDRQENLKILFDKAIKELEGIKRDIVSYEKQHAFIVSKHGRLVKLYQNHLDHLEETGNRLLGIYRVANREARDGEVPERFSEPWEMERAAINTDLENVLTKEEISEIIIKAEAKVSQGVNELKENYNKHSIRLSHLALHLMPA